MPGSLRIAKIAGIDISINDVLPLMAGRDINQLPVVENGVVVGILSRDAIMRHLAVRHGLGLDADEGHVEKRLADAA